MVGPEWWIPALRAISDMNAYIKSKEANPAVEKDGEGKRDN